MAVKRCTNKIRQFLRAGAG